LTIGKAAREYIASQNLRNLGSMSKQPIHSGRRALALLVESSDIGEKPDTDGTGSAKMSDVSGQLFLRDSFLDGGSKKVQGGNRNVRSEVVEPTQVEDDESVVDARPNVLAWRTADSSNAIPVKSTLKAVSENAKEFVGPGERVRDYGGADTNDGEGSRHKR
jgi:hypothetical protein